VNESLARVYGRRGNHALVQLDGRKYPGLLVQGDSLKQVETIVEDLVELRRQGEDGEFDEALHEVAEVVKALTDSYESMMREVNLDLPY
jgi:uncharacterized protein DUF6959